MIPSNRIVTAACVTVSTDNGGEDQKFHGGEEWRRRSQVLIFALNRQCMRVRVSVSLVRLAPRT